jgi:prefoldin alpha subunit
MDEQTTRKIREMRAIQAQIEEGQHQLSSLQSFTNDVIIALNTVKNIKDASKGESLFPIGSGVFVRASVRDGAKVLVEIGAGVVAEKTPEETAVILQSRLDEVDKAANSIQVELKKLMDRNDALVDELQKAGVN